VYILIIINMYSLFNILGFENLLELGSSDRMAARVTCATLSRHLLYVPWRKLKLDDWVNVRLFIP